MSEIVLNKIPVVVMTSPVTEWALRGFWWQFQKHCGQFHANMWVDPFVFGYEEMDPEQLPEWCRDRFISIGRFADYPMSKWSDSFIGVLHYLKRRNVQSFLLFLDDYWITRDIDVMGLQSLFAYHWDKVDHILKIDTAFDRMNADWGRYYAHSGGAGTAGHCDLIHSSADMQYAMSLWAGFFSTNLLLDMLRTGWTAQQVELEGTPILRSKSYYVLGTRQGPTLHTNVCHDGKFFDFAGPPLTDEDMTELRLRGLTNGR